MDGRRCRHRRDESRHQHVFRQQLAVSACGMVAGRHVVPSGQIGIGGRLGLTQWRRLIERPQFQRLAHHRRKKHKHHCRQAKPDGQSFAGAGEMHGGPVSLPGGRGVDNANVYGCAVLHRKKSIGIQICVKTARQLDCLTWFYDSLQFEAGIEARPKGAYLPKQFAALPDGTLRRVDRQAREACPCRPGGQVLAR